MARFEKLKSFRDTSYWHLILEDLMDIIKYNDIDTNRIAEEFVCQYRQKEELGVLLHGDSTRTNIVQNLNTLCEISHRSPLDILSEVTTSKIKAMMKMIENGDQVCVNSNGGYCDYAGFVRIHKMEVLISLAADAPYSFPINDSISPLNVTHLVLENSYHFPETFNYVKEEKSWGMVNELKDRSEEFIYESLKNCSHVYISSQLLDVDQLDKMMQLFKLLPCKIVTLKLGSGSKEKLTNHKDFMSLLKIHTIKFI